MSSSIRLVRPTSSLARNHFHLLDSRTTLSGSVGTLLAGRTFSSTFIRNNSQSSGGESKGAIDRGKVEIEHAEEEIKKKAAEEAERKRLEAQDAALKEILDSAAAEKKKIEEEAIKIAKEKAQKAAKEAAEAAEAEAARTRVKARLEAERQAAEKLKQQQTSAKTTGQVSGSNSLVTSPKDTLASKSDIGSASASKSMEEKVRLGNSGVIASVAEKSSSAGSEEHWTKVNEPSIHPGLGDDPLEPFKARLLPYKRSLESSTEYLRSSLPESFRQLSESVKRKDYKSTIAQLSEHLNNFTGYNSINELKHKVITHGDRLDEARIKLVQAKHAYEDAIRTRSDTQKAINDLLQRKHLWSPNDVIRFTDLYRSEHANEQAELKTRAEYKEAEANVEEKSRKLTTIIMERYHEEQVWSDKIRAASTYGTWGLIGMNVMAFLIVQAFVEPRRRRKQIERYEGLVQDLTERGILPERTQSITAAASGSTELPFSNDVSAASAARSQPDSNSGSTSDDAPVVTVGGALLGGEDVLAKLIQSAERQEERLDRMESMLIKQIPGALEQDKETIEHGPGLVLADDGTPVFITEEDEAAMVDMGEIWTEEKNQGAGSRGWSEIVVEPSLRAGSRFSRVLSDGDAEVIATRRDFLISGLGGALIGGLVTLAVMMNR
ncbi:sensitivity to high expression protein she9 [Haplosporangium sp. Z 767]|nr:sensitivity to high expression protein she9 [Haplosporangium sp. Z 767]KAF9183619.1 sensitivity to high expression protein she9 [Haplosporangium sp. Z 11]